MFFIETFILECLESNDNIRGLTGRDDEEFGGEIFRVHENGLVAAFFIFTFPAQSDLPQDLQLASIKNSYRDSGQWRC